MSSPLHRWAGYLFHGSPSRYNVLVPVRPHTYVGEDRAPDGDPSVCATEEPDVAVFMAVMPSAMRPGGTGFYAFGRDASGARVFLASPHLLDDRDVLTGFVHVIERDGFRPFRDEWRVGRPVEPVDVVEVSGRDLPEVRLVDEVPPDVQV